MTVTEAVESELVVNKKEEPPASLSEGEPEKGIVRENTVTKNKIKRPLQVTLDAIKHPESVGAKCKFCGIRVKDKNELKTHIEDHLDSSHSSFAPGINYCINVI